MEAISHIGSTSSGGAVESSGRNLQSYRSYPAPSADGNGVVRRGLATNREATQAARPPLPSANAARFFADVLRNGTAGGAGGAGTSQNNFFRLGSSGASSDANARVSSSGSLFETAGQREIAKAGNRAVTSGHSDVALGRSRGVFSERFVEANPTFSPPPRELPNSNSNLSLAGSNGDLSHDLLRALQRYRVAAEIQG